MNDNEKIKLARALIGEAAVWCLDGGEAPNDSWAAKAWAFMNESIHRGMVRDPESWAALQLVRAHELLGEMQEHLSDAEASPCRDWFRRMFLLDGSHMVLCEGLDDGAVWIPGDTVEDSRATADPEEFKIIDEVNKPGSPANTEGDSVFGAFVRVLNESLAADPFATIALIERRIDCNEKLANHPTIQCGQVKPGAWEVGLLGIVNGICEASTGRRVAMVISDNGVMMGFEEYKSAGGEGVAG